MLLACCQKVAGNVASLLPACACDEDRGDFKINMIVSRFVAGAGCKSWQEVPERRLSLFCLDSTLFQVDLHQVQPWIGIEIVGIKTTSIL